MRRYRKLKDEALDRTPWRTRFRGCYGPVLNRQRDDDDDDDDGGGGGREETN